MDVGLSEVFMDYYEDDKRFRREEYEGNLLEVGLELENDEDVSVVSCCLGMLGGYGLGRFVCRRWGGGGSEGGDAGGGLVIFSFVFVFIVG